VSILFQREPVTGTSSFWATGQNALRSCHYFHTLSLSRTPNPITTCRLIKKALYVSTLMYAHNKHKVDFLIPQKRSEKTDVIAKKHK
jgi:hypothetical protein